MPRGHFQSIRSKNVCNRVSYMNSGSRVPQLIHCWLLCNLAISIYYKLLPTIYRHPRQAMVFKGVDRSIP